MGDTTFLYALLEPDRQTIRYIGKADNPQRRFREHLRTVREGEATHKACWIRKLMEAAQMPVLFVLGAVPVPEWPAWERVVISVLRQRGAQLTNTTEGGENPPVGRWLGRKHSAESRRKIGAAGKGRRHSAESRIKMSNAGKERKHSVETRDKMRAAKLGKKYSLETRARMSAAKSGENHPNFGKQLLLETRNKIGKANRGKKRTIAECERLRRLHTGRKHSMDTRIKMSESQTGRKHSTDSRIKMSESRLKWLKTQNERQPKTSAISSITNAKNTGSCL